MLLSKDWKDYKILDMADGIKLEKWGDVILQRPDPQIIWSEKEKPELWKKTNAKYIRSNSGGGMWDSNLRDFVVSYKDLKFNVKLMGFKHTGIFPEQAYNWDYIIESIQKRKKENENKGNNENIKVLNLFAYTGGATLASLKGGADVVHVDSSKGITQIAKQNVDLNFKNPNIRYIVDDCLKFMKREIRRGHHYDGIIMDPPSYGRGPNGEVWKFEENINELLELANELLTPNPIFVIVNTYTTGFSKHILETLMQKKFKKFVNKPNAKIFADELVIPVENSKMVLPCGITGHLEVN